MSHLRDCMLQVGEGHQEQPPDVQVGALNVPESESSSDDEVSF